MGALAEFGGRGVEGAGRVWIWGGGEDEVRR